MIELLTGAVAAVAASPVSPWVAVLLAVHGLAVAVVNATPTPKDNEWLARIYKGVEVLAGIFHPRAKQ